MQEQQTPMNIIVICRDKGIEKKEKKKHVKLLN